MWISFEKIKVRRKKRSGKFGGIEILPTLATNMYIHPLLKYIHNVDTWNLLLEYGIIYLWKKMQIAMRSHRRLQEALKIKM
jgi:hypothetical protein